MKKEVSSLYSRCAVAKTMVENRRAYSPRIVENKKKKKPATKHWRAYLE